MSVETFANGHAKRAKKHGRINDNAVRVAGCCFSRVNRTSGPLLVVGLAALLFSCNVVWLYSSGGHQNRGVCIHVSDVWGAQVNSTSMVGADYQHVKGSGFRQVPVPIPIPNDTLLLGTEDVVRNGEKPRFMTIGISTVWRKENYLYQTLDSIIRETSEEEKLDIIIILLLADSDPLTRTKRSRMLEIRYKEHLDQGLLIVIQPPRALYPSIDFTSIRRTYNDSVERIQWRTKQVLDFAFLFWYSWSLNGSKHFLFLEDDILSARHFVSATKDFVDLQKKHHWIALQLAGFLGIGHLVRTADLNHLVTFLLLFYREHPVDILFNRWVQMMVPDKPIKNRPNRRIPGLFQHIGTHSTLANKIQRLKDSTFSLVKRRFSHVNPSADVVSNIRQYKSFMADLAYSSAPGMFWGIPKSGDTFDIVFPQPLHLARLFILTGTAVQQKRKVSKLRDKLIYGHVEVSGEFSKMENSLKAICSNFIFVEYFKDGEFDFKGFPELFPEGIQCIRIVIDPKQTSWIAVTEIAVFTMDEIDVGEPERNRNQVDRKSSGDESLITEGKVEDKNRWISDVKDAEKRNSGDKNTVS